jgi:hypothetical protein
MNPGNYLRPKAAPKQGTIDAAEKVIAKLEAEGSLGRRYARLDELALFWRPAPTKGGIFAELRRQESREQPLRANRYYTWVEFEQTILPTAVRAWVRVPHGKQAFGAVTGPVNMDAPNVLRWNNPYSFYVYLHGSEASNWRLSSGLFAPLTGITGAPSSWAPDSPYGDKAPQDRMTLLLLAGAREKAPATLGLFPETLTPELHGVRSVIEAYSNRNRLTGLETSTANGLFISAHSGGWPLTVRVTNDRGAELDYTIGQYC